MGERLVSVLCKALRDLAFYEDIKGKHGSQGNQDKRDCFKQSTVKLIRFITTRFYLYDE